MEMSNLWNTPSKRHQRSKKYLKRRTTNTKSYQKNKVNEKNIFFIEPVSQREIVW